MGPQSAHHPPVNSTERLFGEAGLTGPYRAETHRLLRTTQRRPLGSALANRLIPLLLEKSVDIRLSLKCKCIRREHKPRLSPRCPTMSLWDDLRSIIKTAGLKPIYARMVRVLVIHSIATRRTKITKRRTAACDRRLKHLQFTTN